MRGWLVIVVLFFPALVSAGNFSQIDDFGYQLQGYSSNLDELKNNSFDLLVMDYSFDGSESGEFSAADIQSIKTSGPCGGKIVVAYFSIGEAESYRFYWNPSWVNHAGNPIPGVAPPWLGPTNPDWVGNYKVRYWQAEWQQIIQQYLDRIIDAGFDGVYLDIVDGFEYWGPAENGGTDEKRDSAKLMVDFVLSIADHARIARGKSDFLVIAQNGAGIVADWTYPDSPDPAAEASLQESRYFPAIDGISSEDTYFSGRKDENNKYKPQKDTLKLLDQFRDGGKKVLCVDYVTKKSKIKKLYKVARDRGFVPYATVRDLDKLIINKSYPPDCTTK